MRFPKSVPKAFPGYLFSQKRSDDVLILVSACLAGLCCRYDGRDNGVGWIRDLVAKGQALPFCPEQMGGLATPREPSEICGNASESGRRVISRNGQDLTGAFLRGAREGMNLVRLADMCCAILKERSPSCGVRKVYSGSFNGVLVTGEGITAELFRRAGLVLFSEEEEKSFRAFMAREKPDCRKTLEEAHISAANIT